MRSISAVGRFNVPQLVPTSRSIDREIEPTPADSGRGSACASIVNNRVHQLYALSYQLKCYSPSEVLMAILLADLNDLSNQRTADSSGLSYLSGIVQAGMIAREVGTLPITYYRPIPSEAIAPVGMRLDVRV